MMRESGYPVDDFDQRAADISVDHPEVAANYREAHRVAVAQTRGEADTEDLRQAVTAYRRLVDPCSRPRPPATAKPTRRTTHDTAPRRTPRPGRPPRPPTPVLRTPAPTEPRKAIDWTVLRTTTRPTARTATRWTVALTATRWTEERAAMRWTVLRMASGPITPWTRSVTTRRRSPPRARPATSRGRVPTTPTTPNTATGTGTDNGALAGTPTGTGTAAGSPAATEQ